VLFIFGKLNEAVEDALPLQIGVVFAESTGEVTDVPLQLSDLVIGLLFKVCSVTGLIDFKQSKHESGWEVILAGAVDCQVKQHFSHLLFVDVLEVLERHREHLVVEATVVSKVYQNLPRF
jgi:hypothetical protein